ncbi:MAG: AraC family transcriptional regulator ligand-binding domain-containing protein [Oceanospirillaceae bacterium]|nr:AraC family transcriptional regulator ligand-binding domain-containing protein [Oceanospirillaceae bacterium]
MHFVSASILHKALRLARAEGINPALLVHVAEHEAVVKQDAYVPIELLFEVYEMADEYLKPGFAVRQGRQLQSEDYGTLGLSWRTCWYARDIFYRLVRFMVLVTDHGSAEVEEDGGVLTMRLNRETHKRGEEMSVETAFVMLINVLDEVCGKQVRPTQVHFAHSSIHGALFEDYFECQVSFQANKNALYFDVKDLQIQTIKADHHINEYLLRRMEEEQKDIQVQADYLLKSIRSLIQESLPSGIPSLTQVADHVKMSPRSLKRKLADKSLTFRGLVQQIQSETALHYLKQKDKSISEITFLTGFSEQSAFNRAFKRWFGESPSSYRSKSE